MSRVSIEQSTRIAGSVCARRLSSTVPREPLGASRSPTEGEPATGKRSRPAVGVRAAAARTRTTQSTPRLVFRLPLRLRAIDSRSDRGTWVVSGFGTRYGVCLLVCRTRHRSGDCGMNRIIVNTAHRTVSPGGATRAAGVRHHGFVRRALGGARAPSLCFCAHARRSRKAGSPSSPGAFLSPLL